MISVYDFKKIVATADEYKIIECLTLDIKSCKYSNVLMEIIFRSSLPIDSKIKYTQLFCLNAKPSGINIDEVSLGLSKLFEESQEKRHDFIKDLWISNPQVDFVKRLTLFLPDITLEQEISALNSISRSSVSAALINNRYCPSFEALKTLSPLSRMLVLERFSALKGIDYNYFSKISSEQMDDLLFSFSIQFRERATNIKSNYRLKSLLNKCVSLQIEADCKVCGLYSCEIKARVTKDAVIWSTLLNNSYNWAGNSCPLCKNILIRKNTEVKEL